MTHVYDIDEEMAEGGNGKSHHLCCCSPIVSHPVLSSFSHQILYHNKQERLVVCIGSKGRLREHRCLTMKGDKKVSDLSRQ